MKHLPGRPVLILGLLLLSFAPGVWAQQEINIYLDFDNDGDPWTLRTTLPEGVTAGTVKFVLEVVSLPLSTDSYAGTVEEGCCNGMQYDAHYGTSVDAQSITFDPAYVVQFYTGFPTCTYCCPWMLTLQFNLSAPLVVGERYFIGQADWDAFCNISVPCTPPTDFAVGWDLAGGSSHMAFVCPPTPNEPYSWGQIKSLYR